LANKKVDSISKRSHVRKTKVNNKGGESLTPLKFGEHEASVGVAPNFGPARIERPLPHIS